MKYIINNEFNRIVDNIEKWSAEDIDRLIEELSTWRDDVWDKTCVSCKKRYSTVKEMENCCDN